jgi:hypothetical protein
MTKFSRIIKRILLHDLYIYWMMNRILSKDKGTTQKLYRAELLFAIFNSLILINIIFTYFELNSINISNSPSIWFFIVLGVVVLIWDKFSLARLGDFLENFDKMSKEDVDKNDIISIIEIIFLFIWLIGISYLHRWRLDR